ncbi:UNVERIFIED_CONTAM: hypothetical protein RMT77_003543 [Armadillidium vulgare]
MKLLTEDQVNSYKKNGFIVLDIFNEKEIDEISDEYNKIFGRHQKAKTESTWKGEDWKKGKDNLEVKSIHAFQMHSAVFTRTILHDKLLDACEDVMGTPNVLLHHTKSHLKPPGTGSPFPMHQDYHYFPFKKDSMVAVFISLDKSEPENGGLCVYPGSHLLGPQEDKSETSEYHYLDLEKFPIEKAIPVNMERGQVVIFSYLLIHGSYDNISDRVRRMFLIQLMSAEDEPIKDIHNSPCQGLVLRGENVQKDANFDKRFVRGEL